MHKSFKHLGQHCDNVNSHHAAKVRIFLFNTCNFVRLHTAHIVFFQLAGTPSPALTMSLRVLFLVSVSVGGNYACLCSVLYGCQRLVSPTACRKSSRVRIQSRLSVAPRRENPPPSCISVSHRSTTGHYPWACSLLGCPSNDCCRGKPPLAEMPPRPEGMALTPLSIYASERKIR